MIHEPTYDIDRPFLAICNDQEPRPGRTVYFESTFGVYLINPLAEPLFEVSTSPSGFFSTDHDVIVSVPKTSDIPDIGPRSYRLIETTSQDEFDELVCSWTIAYRIGERSYTRSFGAGKALQTTQWCDEIPILGKPGLLAHS